MMVLLVRQPVSFYSQLSTGPVFIVIESEGWGSVGRREGGGAHDECIVAWPLGENTIPKEEKTTTMILKQRKR